MQRKKNKNQESSLQKQRHLQISSQNTHHHHQHPDHLLACINLPSLLTSASMEAFEVKGASTFQQTMRMQKSRHFFDRRNLFGSGDGNSSSLVGSRRRNSLSLSPSPLFLRRLQCACVHARARKPNRPTSNLAHWKPTRARCNAVQCMHAFTLHTYVCARAQPSVELIRI